MNCTYGILAFLKWMKSFILLVSCFIEELVSTLIFHERYTLLKILKAKSTHAFHPLLNLSGSHKAMDQPT